MFHKQKSDLQKHNRTDYVLPFNFVCKYSFEIIDFKVNGRFFNLRAIMLKEHLMNSNFSVVEESKFIKDSV
jgi:hypothetical protein